MLFDDLPPPTGTVLRTSLFGRWAADFLAIHPTGTVVEIGTGLNTRYERTDNGWARWFELEPPDVIVLRRGFFDDTPRRTMIAASVTDETWADTVAAHFEGPCLFAVEAVLPFRTEVNVHRLGRATGRRGNPASRSWLSARSAPCPHPCTTNFRPAPGKCSSMCSPCVHSCGWPPPL
ncbi:class I SAM-dependent methyltransferase [Streptomyces sp. NPDC058632]|uniref:class I SAM-dependent methyltransferase n=1 Tax=unclassified Streptomyces TaxID=2593676 RepID=UPI003668AB38